MKKLQPAVKKETVRISLSVSALTIIMIAVFIALKYLLGNVDIFKNIDILGVVIGGVGAAFITCLNFFLMALTVQKVTAIEDKDEAKRAYRKSYYLRMMLEIAWMAGAIVIYKNGGIINPVAALLPFIFPSLAIKLIGIVTGSKSDTGPGRPYTEDEETEDFKEVETEATAEKPAEEFLELTPESEEATEKSDEAVEKTAE